MNATGDGPDPTDPDRVFADGGHYFEVAIWPVRYPVRFSQNPDSGIFSVKALIGIYVLAVEKIARTVDPRYKVVVSRIGRRGLVWRVVHVEVLGDKDTAELRRGDILRDWEPGKFSSVEPLRRAQRPDRG